MNPQHRASYVTAATEFASVQGSDDAEATEFGLWIQGMDDDSMTLFTVLDQWLLFTNRNSKS